MKCYKHGGNEFNLRARLEDLIEIENKRAGKGFPHRDQPMTFSDASRLLNGAILCMRILGWAWRWAEWWTEYSSNWEPLLEPGQNEKKMTKEELKIVDSTPESRREDARRCRLAAFGAALRNRNYDVRPDDNGLSSLEFSGGFDHNSLEQALRAILSTTSLVGPLKNYEIDFYIEWLGRAYRSKSRLLGFGDDKIPVGKGDFCLHAKDNTPKYELGSRSLPGKQELPPGRIFEVQVDEVDDFDVFHEAVANNPSAPKASSAKRPGKSNVPSKEHAVSNVSEETDDEELSAVPRKRGRPPSSASNSVSPPRKRGPGRPPKSSPKPSDTGRTAAPLSTRRGPGRPRRQEMPVQEAPNKEDSKKVPHPRDPIDRDKKRSLHSQSAELPEMAEQPPKKRRPGRLLRVSEPEKLATEGSSQHVFPGRQLHTDTANAAAHEITKSLSAESDNIFDAVKKRPRGKPQLFSEEQVAADDENNPRRRRRGRSAGMAAASVEDEDSELDLTITELASRAKKANKAKAAKDRPDKNSDRNENPAESESGETAKQTHESEDDEPLEDLLENPESYLKQAKSSVQRARLLGKYEAHEVFFGNNGHLKFGHT